MNMDQKKKSSVGRKLILFFLFSAILISSLGISLSFYQDYAFYNSKVKKSFDRIDQFIIPEITKSLTKEDFSGVHSILNTLLSGQDYSYISLRLGNKGESPHNFFFSKRI